MHSLTRLQHWLQRVYEIDVPLNVTDFLITDHALAQALQGNADRPACKEKLLVHESAGELAMSLFLSPEVVNVWEDAGDPSMAERANACCQAIEGVSHFLYLAWRAGFNRELTQLELELQAEIDKFIGLSTMTGGGGFEETTTICTWLFDGVSYEPGLKAEAKARYEAANFYAGQYCRHLNERYVRGHDSAGLTRELRRFYRQGEQGKLGMIPIQSR